MWTPIVYSVFSCTNIYCMYNVHRSDKTSGGRHKGSALAIAAEYKRRKQAGELSPREAARASMITKRINESEHKSEYKPAKQRKLEVHIYIYVYIYRYRYMYV